MTEVEVTNIVKGGSIHQKSPDLREELRIIVENKARRVRLNSNRVIAELAAIAFSDITKVFDSNGHTLPLEKIPHHTRRAIASFNVRRRTHTRIGPNGKKVRESVELVSVRLHSKLPALYALGRYLGMFRERPAPILE